MGEACEVWNGLHQLQDTHKYDLPWGQGGQHYEYYVLFFSLLVHLYKQHHTARETGSVASLPFFSTDQKMSQFPPFPFFLSPCGDRLPHGHFPEENGGSFWQNLGPSEAKRTTVAHRPLLFTEAPEEVVTAAACAVPGRSWLEEAGIRNPSQTHHFSLLKLGFFWAPNMPALVCQPFSCRSPQQRHELHEAGPLQVLITHRSAA